MADHPVPLPDGMDENDLEQLDLKSLYQTNPEKAMILADFAMKHQVKTSRTAWIEQAHILYFVKETDLWRYHPESYSSFFAWCQQPEIELPPSVVSDMLAIVRFAPALQEQADVDIFDVIGEVGHSKVRQLIPLMRDAYRDGTLAEQIGPMIDEIKGSSFRGVLKMVSTSGQRIEWDPAVTYIEKKDGGYQIVIDLPDLDQLELLAQKLSVKRWFDQRGYRIENPLNQLPPEEE